MTVQPSILPGFMELLPEEQVLFEHVKATIETVYRKYGYWPLDTPAIEKDEILFAKGGGETTKQIYHIAKGEHASDQSLRFDLTVPLARYVAQHTSELAFPFRRYHIGKVYRGERNQKGRYREFYQADIDVIGMEQLSVLNDAEVPAAIFEIFSRLGIPGVRFHINHRGLLNGFFASIGISDSEAVLHAVDKLAKIGADGVSELLDEAGLTEEQKAKTFAFIGVTDERPAMERLASVAEGMDASLPGGETFLNSWADFQTIVRAMEGFGIPSEHIVVDTSITRGLDYYTGVVYETFIDGYESLGSVASGGRYEDLASNFSKTKMPGVGISIGLTRLFYQLREAGLIAPKKGDYIAALVIPMGQEETAAAIHVVRELREVGLSAKLYTEPGKMKKKFSYADQEGVRFVIIIGENERKEGTVSIKEMESGDQRVMPLNEAIRYLLEQRSLDGKGRE